MYCLQHKCIVFTSIQKTHIELQSLLNSKLYQNDSIGNTTRLPGYLHQTSQRLSGQWSPHFSGRMSTL